MEGGQIGVETESPSGLAGASWVRTERDAQDEFEQKIASYAAQTTGEERLFRLKLVVGGNVVDTRLVAVGEITPEPDVLDGLSLTYIGVLASVALAVAFGLDGLSALSRLLLFLGLFFGVALLLRAGRPRRGLLVFARWALRGSYGYRA